MTTTVSSTTTVQRPRRFVILGALAAAALIFSACSSDSESVEGVGETEETGTEEAASGESDNEEAGTEEEAASGESDSEETGSEEAGTDEAESDEADGEEAAPEESDGQQSDDAAGVDVAAGCEDIASLFGTRGSANPNLDDPVSSAVCEGGMVVISANGIPDYPYVETSPGPPGARDLNYEIPAEPTVAAETTAVPLVGAIGVTLAGIPIYGPTEGTSGDVKSIPGILMECGSHNGPTGFHLHLVGTSETNSCDFTAEEIASGPQLFGYAFDGYPIYTGNDQYTSSWELTDDSLFATDTWAAHTYAEGSGDLDECNGLTDADGNYAYYTTDEFPYIIGCFVGDVEIAGPGGGGGGGGGDRPGEEGGGGARRGGGEEPAGDEDAEGRPPTEEEDEDA